MRWSSRHVDLLTGMIFTLPGVATSVRCSAIVPWGPRRIHATVVPSGEMVAPLGWDTLVNCWLGLAVSGASVRWDLAGFGL